jgi:heavy metal translocating P-type ATPase/RND family efflux transporter MFP subunit
MPVTRRAGEAVSSGAINAGETFEMRATARAGDSAYAGIVRLVEAAQTERAPFIRMADRYALLLIPVTLLITGAAWWFSGDPVRAVAVLVTATPCPLILAAPAAFIGGTSRAARRGVLVKGGGPFETLARIHTVMFDKTGTLTVGGARLVAVETAPGVAPEEALALAASLEQASQHVLAATIVATARNKGLALHAPRDVREALGSGLAGVVDGRKVSVGSLQFVHGEGRLEEWARRAARRAAWRSALTVFVAVDDQVIAVLLFADELRRETPRAIDALRRAGAARIVMVTGDRAEPAETIGAALDLDAVLAERIPSDKVDAVVAERRRAPTLMVGDGVNDAPALAAADVGLAMGARGASASSEAADVVLLVDRLDRVAEAVAIARRTRAIAMQSMIAGMGLSGVAMAAAAFGHITPVVGAILQEAIDVAAILNALRALAPPGRFEQPPMSEEAATVLREEHEKLEPSLERLRQIVDALDVAKDAEAVNYVREANHIVRTAIVRHEREDEESIYPRVSDYLGDRQVLSVMSRAHREILHQARLLGRLSDELQPGEADSYLLRDAQRIIESIESLVHIHNAQEEDIYEQAAAQTNFPADASGAGRNAAPRATAFERALEPASVRRRRWRILAGALAVAGAVVLAALAAGGLPWGLDLYARFREGAPMSGRPPAEITARGVVRHATSRPISATVSGVVETVSCEVGAVVKAGQVCATIDAGPIRSIVEVREAELATAKRALEQTRDRLARAQARHERDRKLAKGRGEAARRLDVSRKSLERAQAETLRAQASVARAEAALGAAQDDLRRMSLSAPIDGTVVARAVQAGDTIRAGRTEPLFLVAADPRIVEIVVAAGEQVARALRIGDAATISVDPGQERRSLSGEVTGIFHDAEATEADRGYAIVVRAATPNFALEPGISATVRFTRVGTRPAAPSPQSSRR